MEKLIKDWWKDTKKDFWEFIDSIPFLASIIFLIYFVVFSSPERMQLAQRIIDEKDWAVIVCICLGILTWAIGVEKLIRFLCTTTWWILSSVGLYIYKKIKN